MRSFRYTLILVGTLALLAGGCGARPDRYSQRAWEAGDVRALDPVDAPDPALDLIALYTRRAGSDFEIRLDLLDIPELPAPPAFDLTVTLFAGPDPSSNLQTGIAQHDTVIRISIPTAGLPAAYIDDDPAPSTVVRPRVTRSPRQDTILISLGQADLPPIQLVQASLSPVGQATVADQVGPVRLDQGLSAPAPLVLVFWNTFPADTPAQAFRRWDGAHTGPRGERHGLVHLLDAAGRSNTPLFLLDLKTPQSLSALEYMGKLRIVERLVSERLLVLPDVAAANPVDISLHFSREAAQSFGIPASPFASHAQPGMPSRYKAAFAPLADASHQSLYGGLRLVPLPTLPPDRQISSLGPSLATRTALLEAALSRDRSDLVVLGGDLPNSIWGSPDHLDPFFEYLSAHPWIQVLNGEQLLVFPATGSKPPVEPAGITPLPVYTSSGAETGWFSTELAARLQTDLFSAPPGPITDLAWQLFLRLTAPATTEAQAALQAQSLGQVGLLLAASRWAHAPAPLQECSLDQDHDREPECILASRHAFAIIERDGARLVYAFLIDEHGSARQLVGPASQLTTGISDPSRWQLALGPAADPGDIPGAFADSNLPWLTYAPSIQADGSIQFTAQDGSRTKSFRLLPDGLEVQYQTSQPVRVSIPLVLSPQTRFSPGWGLRYIFLPTETGWVWGIHGDLAVELVTSAPSSFQPFNTSSRFTAIPEDPNLSYPAGHYLPFPLGLGEVQVDGSAVIQLLWR